MGGWALFFSAPEIILFLVFAAGTRNVTGPGGSAYQLAGLPMSPEPLQPPTPAGKHVKLTVYNSESQTSILIQLQQNPAISGISNALYRRLKLVHSSEMLTPLAERD